MKNVFIIIQLSLLVSGCFLIRNECGYRSSKTYNFKILRKNHDPLDQKNIKTNGVYVNSYRNSQETLIYMYYRYFENGRCITGRTSSVFPDEDKLNSLFCGNVGYYRCTNDTIIIETHNAAAGYVYHYFKKINDEIEFIGFKKRRRSAKFTPISSSIKYFFHEAKLYTEANW